MPLVHRTRLGDREEHLGICCARHAAFDRQSRLGVVFVLLIVASVES
jgi:hypothetical protein